ncbi:hypothetical protein OBBRIDRAFT_738892, partial [Obba rivulosa]
RTLAKVIIDHAHITIGHFRLQKISEYVWWWFWWPKIDYNIKCFCVTCGTCQTTRPHNHLQQGMLHSLSIP